MIGLVQIFKDQIDLIQKGHSKKVCFLIIFVYFVIPIIVSMCVFLLEGNYSIEMFLASVSFYGIFLALLLNLQVGFYFVLKNVPDKGVDERAKLARLKIIAIRKQLGREINTTVSYLVNISLILIFISFFIYLTGQFFQIVFSILAGVSLHVFLITIALAHKIAIFFRQEYS